MAATVKASKATAKRPGRRPSRPAYQAPPPPEPEVDGLEVDDDGFEVLRVSGDDVPEERVPLFYIGDQEFTILANPDAGIGLEALHIVAGGGGSPLAQAMADDYVLTQMLGEDGYAAFRRTRKLTDVQRRWVLKQCTDRAMGVMQDPKS